MRSGFLLVGPTAAALLSGCDQVEPAGAAAAGGVPPEGAPNVLIVVLDAMRADRVGAYGYPRETTPNIDEVAADPDAVLFHDHFVQGAYTKSSTASLFSGLYVFQHGVVWGHVVREDPTRPGLVPAQIFRDEFDTMAERFSRLGYSTFGVVKSHHLDARYGFGQGFDEYWEASVIRNDQDRVYKTAAITQAGPQPFFGYLHLAACHHPFPPPSRHRGYMQEYGYEAGLLYDEMARIEAGVDFTTSETQHAINDGDLRLEPADVDFLNLVYEAELRRADEIVGGLFRALKASGLWDSTLLIVTADHGEELYDHEGYAHGHALWDEVVRVPLIVKFPRGAKPDGLDRDVREVTQAVDLLPTLLDYVGADPGDELPGSQIFYGPRRGLAWSETHEEWTLIHDGYKLIDGGDRTLLFDRRADPGERRDLADADPDRVASMRRAAEALRAHVAIKASEAPLVESELSEETIETLRSLGYVR